MPPRREGSENASTMKGPRQHCQDEDEGSGRLELLGARDSGDEAMHAKNQAGSDVL